MQRRTGAPYLQFNMSQDAKSNSVAQFVIAIEPSLVDHAMTISVLYSQPYMEMSSYLCAAPHSQDLMKR